MKRLLLIVCLFVCSFSILSAKCTKQCFVRYETNYGWSKYYYVQVHFVTGSELNRATYSYNYSFYAKYAVIFWERNQCSIIKISNTLFTGYDFECDVLSFGFNELDGVDQDGDRWRICAYDNMIESKKMFGY